MKKKILILIGLLMISGVALAAQQTPPYPAQYWVIGTLSKDPARPAPTVEGYKVVLCSDKNVPASAFAYAISDSGGNFSINAYDDLRLAPKSGQDYWIGVVNKNDFGVNAQIISLNSQGFTVRDLVLKYGEGMIDPIGGVGPTISIKILLESYYVSALPTKSKTFTVEVEARSGASPGTATNIAGSCMATFDPADGYVKNPGSYWEEVPADGNYYLAIKHLLPGNVAGTNHLPIITKDQYPLALATPLVADLTTGDKAYQRTGNYLPALQVKDALQMLWLGDYNGDQNISPADIGLWSFDYKKFMENGASSYEVRADFNADGFISPADAGLWSFNYLQAVSKAAPNAYVP